MKDRSEHPKPYNPLDKRNLGEDVAKKLLAAPLNPLPPTKRFMGAGVYAIYYNGEFALYKKISAAGRRESDRPIYIGKADPSGGRKGGFEVDAPPGPELFNRLGDHAKSIGEASNLRPDDFRCRYLVVEDIWIRLAERILIEKYRPVWNVVVEGFGIHQPGKGRHGQKLSEWDVLHPGRSWTQHHKTLGHTAAEVSKKVEEFLSRKGGKP